MLPDRPIIKINKLIQKSFLLVFILTLPLECDALVDTNESANGCPSGKAIAFDAERIEVKMIPPSVFHRTKDGTTMVVDSQSYQVVITTPKTSALDLLHFAIAHFNCSAEVKIGDALLKRDLLSQIFPASTANQTSRFVDLTPKKSEFSLKELRDVVSHSKHVEISIQ